MVRPAGRFAVRPAYLLRSAHMDLTPATLTVVQGCPFQLSDTSICNDPNVFARGFCQKHYRSLSRAGVFKPDSQTLSRRDQTVRNVAAIKRAQKKLLKLAPDFVDLFHEGAKVSAKTGDTKPTQWALLHTRVVEPVQEKSSSTPSHSQPVINIGVKVSGVSDKEK